MKAEDFAEIIRQFVDYVQPELVPYETSFYIFLLRKSIFNNEKEIRIGKRTIANTCGKGTRSDKANFKHVNKVLRSLEEKGCIKIGDTNKLGTLYIIKLPNEIPFASEKMRSREKKQDEDYFNDENKRKEINGFVNTVERKYLQKTLR